MSALLQRIVNAEPPIGASASEPLDVGLLQNSVSSALWRGTAVSQFGQAVVPSGFQELDA